MTETSALFSPLMLGGLGLANRIVASPMCQYSAEEGCATDWHLMHLGQLAVSGAGLVMTESAHVTPQGRITHSCLGLYSDDNEAALARVVEFCRRHSPAKLGIQLSHAGRKGSTRLPAEGRNRPLTDAEGAWPTVGASGIARADGWPDPAPLDAPGIEAICAAHADAARRAAHIGFDLLELVMAHGYLLHEFLSPLTNRRDDAYGGDAIRRARFPLDVFDAVRDAWPADRPLGVRLSATDYADGGWSLGDTVALAVELERRGCDYVAVSSGGLLFDQRVPTGEGHQVDFAATVRREADIPVMAMGMIADPHHAEAIIREGAADAVALARTLLVDPRWPWHAAQILGAAVDFPPQYLRGYKSAWHRTQRAADGQGSSKPPKLTPD
ncbi:MAG: NADH:flavin oxidoreductase/NADH oxidase [Alphaproteobacteria bacterium]|nr:NADH:flavin oxidoreductase/NADH oxidase [Alphaproteobacteria bacterium]